MSIVMDSRTPQEPKPDAEKNLAIRLLKLFVPAQAAQGCEDRLRAGGLGYGDLKKALFQHYWDYFAPARAKRAELKANLDYVERSSGTGPPARGPKRAKCWTAPRSPPGWLEWS